LELGLAITFKQGSLFVFEKNT
jgi:hypothetical protein